MNKISIHCSTSDYSKMISMREENSVLILQMIPKVQSFDWKENVIELFDDNRRIRFCRMTNRVMMFDKWILLQLGHYSENHQRHFFGRGKIRNSQMFFTLFFTRNWVRCHVLEQRIDVSVLNWFSSVDVLCKGSYWRERILNIFFEMNDLRVRRRIESKIQSLKSIFGNVWTIFLREIHQRFVGIRLSHILRPMICKCSLSMMCHFFVLWQGNGTDLIEETAKPLQRQIYFPRSEIRR